MSAIKQIVSFQLKALRMTGFLEFVQQVLNIVKKYNVAGGHITALGLASLVAQLKTSNEAVRTLLSQRNEPVAWAEAHYSKKIPGSRTAFGDTSFTGVRHQRRRWRYLGSTVGGYTPWHHRD